jgi:pimeloyl-ACP methyl ester carboxylesterase
VSSWKAPWRWLGRAVGLLVLLTLVLAVAGAAYQALALRRDRLAHPPPGRLVDVDGRRMHLYCAGQGSPTVIFESGMSDSWLVWHRVQPVASQLTRTCSYDRAGIGWSDPSPRPRTSRVIAEELHALLRAANISGPYVLVGHSLGGPHVRVYTSLYPDEVAGVVLVDPSHPDQTRRFPDAALFQRQLERDMEKLAWVMPLGLPRWKGWCGGAAPEIREAFRAFDCTVKQKRGWLAEAHGIDESLSQAASSGSLGSRPLVVLSEDPDPTGPAGQDPNFKAFLSTLGEMHEELARLSSRGIRVLARGSGHYIFEDRPDTVIAAVQDVVKQCQASVGQDVR